VDWIEKTGRTVEEAVESALRELDLGRDQVEVEVVEEPQKGLFGLLGAREAKVRVRPAQRKARFAAEFLEQLTKAMGLQVDISWSESDGYVRVSLQGENLGLLIGRRGQTLDALQFLVNVAAARVSAERKKVLLDVAGYRERREDTLRRLALRLGEKVKRTGRKVVLEPMNAHERKIIHLTLQGVDGVTTRSEGRDPYRKVVISATSEA